MDKKNSITIDLTVTCDMINNNQFNCISFIEKNFVSEKTSKNIITIYCNSDKLKNIMPTKSMDYYDKIIYKFPENKEEFLSSDISNYLYKLENGNIYNFIFAKTTEENFTYNIKMVITTIENVLVTNTINIEKEKVAKSIDKLSTLKSSPAILLNSEDNKSIDKENKFPVINSSKCEEILKTFRRQMSEKKFEDTIRIIAEETYTFINNYKKIISEKYSPAWGRLLPIEQDGYIEAVLYTIAYNPKPEALHNKWCRDKISQGWIYGKIKNETYKTHPCLIERDKLPLTEKYKDELFIVATSYYSNKYFEYYYGYLLR